MEREFRNGDSIGVDLELGSSVERDKDLKERIVDLGILLGVWSRDWIDMLERAENLNRFGVKRA